MRIIFSDPYKTPVRCNEYCKCTNTGWQQPDYEDVKLAVFKKFGDCNENNLGEIKISRTLASYNSGIREYVCGTEGWRVASEDDIYKS